MRKNTATLMATALLLASCATDKTGATQETAPIIGKQTEIKIENGRMTPEALWAMGRIGDYQLASNGKQIVYTVAYYSVEQNKSHRVIYVMNADGTDNTLLTTSAFSESNPVWIKNDSKIAFLSSESGKSQIWEMNPDGTGRRQISDFDGDIEGFTPSPTGDKILFVAQVKYGQRTVDLYPDLPKTTGILVDDLMYKHWDEWVETVPHPYVADFNGEQMGKATDILAGEPYESPMKPFGGMEQLAWSPDGKQIAYTCRKKTGLAYTISTDSDIYLYNIENAQTINLCKQNGKSTDGKDMMAGYDTNPAFSPDGKYIAWQSMERDGYESDRNRLCVFDLQSGEKHFITEAFDSSVDVFCWERDSKHLYFIGVWHGTSMIYRTNLKGEVVKLTDGDYDYASVALGNPGQLIVKRHSISHADEIFSVMSDEPQATSDHSEGKLVIRCSSLVVEQLTHENDHIFSQLKLGKVEPRWTTTTDGKQMLSWVIYPTDFDPNKKYPTLLFCQGGPQSPVSQFWSFRWNFQIMAANDYIIIAPNRRGLPGIGSEWNEAISGDYGGQCMKDYLSAIDDFAREPYVDADRLGCVGASFGGFSVYWLAGHHDKRFKAFIAHDGIFNIEQQYLETEEMWFANWDMGGAYWEKDNPIAQRTFANSPHKFVDKWDTPILCIHGEKDYRILASQGMSAFNAAVLRGVPAQLLIYPDENHWVLRPQNGILWQRTFFNWLDKWLKKETVSSK
ncbi:MAG: S9 family peptidase [Bacteroidaceae bacterium]|nr:S9 family peptidase [Bacteroidaceae bacterium]